MDNVAIGYLGLGIGLLMLLLGVPVAFGLGAVGLIGIAAIVGVPQALSQAGLVFFHEGTNLVLVAVPLFILMGNLANHTGIASGLFRAMADTLGRLPGGLAIASVFGSAGFSAIAGSSTATVVTMGRIIVPELKKYNYDRRLGAGTLAAAGTLGILIPPSLVLIFYGIMTENSIAALFIAGIMPGLLTVIVFALVIWLGAMARPNLAPPIPGPGLRDTLRSLRGTLPIFGLFAVIIGGIYFGIFTPTEAAGIAVTGVVLYGLVARTLTWRAARAALLDTVVVSGMIFAIVFTGYFLSRFIAITGLTDSLIQVIVAMELGSYEFILVITVMYLLLGCAMDVLAMILLTVPFVYPIIIHLGFDPIWFGIYIVIMAEIAMITPPLGLNLFVMRAIAPDTSFAQICVGAIPFVIAELVITALITVYPQIVLWMVP